MEVDDETQSSPNLRESSSPITNDQKPVSTEPNVSVPIIPPPPVVPTIAPIPAPPRVLRPPVPPNGEVINSDSGSDDSGPEQPSSTVGYVISEESRSARERHKKAIDDMMMRRRASALAVPTNDMAVRARLRKLGEPITLFGEREMERRDRLRMIMAKLDGDGQLERLMKLHEEESAVPEDHEDGNLQYPFFTEGPKALLDARIDIANWSIPRAASRLERARRRRDDPDEDMNAEMDWALKQAKSLALSSSEIGDDRPLSGCSFSQDGTLLATCALNGVAKLWSMPKVGKVSTLKGHTERLTDVTFSPTDNHLLATASADCTARLWNTEGLQLMTFGGHLDRLARIAFHPTGKYLGTTSFDKTWRLWDINTGTELLLQEGHSRSVYGIDFHHDGSLVASCGLDSHVRVWDLRTGLSIMTFQGHVKPVLGLSFSVNGQHLASGGEDNTCRIWDLRKKSSVYIIPAHSNLISQVKFEPQEGYFLVTASYDLTAKIWSARDFKHIKTLSGHEAKVTALDVPSDGSCIATVSHDRTIKLWCRDDNYDNEEGDPAMDVD